MRIPLAIGALDVTSGVIERRDGDRVELTPQERTLAAYLVARPNEDVDREVLQTEVLGYASGAQTRAVDDAVRRLRSKIERLPERPFHLVGVRGTGYRFVPLAAAAPNGRCLTLGARTVDLDRLEVIADGAPVALSSTEGRLLEVLAAHGGRPVGWDVLLREVWNCPDPKRRKLVDRAVYRLRPKLEDDPKEPRHLRTVRGRGLVLDVDEATAPASPPSAAAEPWRCTPPAADPLGRTDDVSRLRAMLADAPALVSVHGPAGVGKTTVAGLVARAWDGPAAWCDLAPATTPADVLRALVEALGVDQADDAPTTPVLRALASAPDGLLVFDNAETCVEPLADLLRTLAAELPLRVLVTTRVLLRAEAEVVLPLAPLPLHDGRALVVRQAGRLGIAVDADDPRVHDAVERLASMPLALELAAARLRVTGLDGLLQRLQAPLRVLTTRGAPRGRHPSLEVALRHSWDGLGGEEQELLCACVGFPGSFSLAGVEQVVGPAVPFDVLDGVEALLDHALLQREPDERFRPSFAVREFVLAHAADSLQALVARTRPALRRWYATLGRDQGPGETPEPSHIRLLLPEIDGAIDAAREATALGEADVAPRIVAWLGSVLELRSHTARARPLAAAAVARFPDDPLALMAAARLGAVEHEANRGPLAVAERLREVGQEDTADRYLGQRLHRLVYEGRDDALRVEAELRLAAGPQGMARGILLSGLGWWHYRSGRPDEAAAMLEEALGVYRGLGKEFEVARVAQSLAGISHHENRFDDARTLIELTLDAYRRAGLEDWNDGPMDTVGLIALTRGRYDEADAVHRRIHERMRRLGLRERESRMASRLGTTAAHRGDHAASMTWFEASRAAALDAGRRSQVCAASFNLAMLSQDDGRLDQARRHYEDVEQGYAELGWASHRAYVQATLAKLDLVEGRLADGVARITEAVPELRASGTGAWLGEALAVEGELRARAGLPGGAERAQEAVALLRGMGPTATLVEAVCRLGQMALLASDVATAEACRDEAVALIEELGLDRGSRSGRAAAALARALAA